MLKKSFLVISVLMVAGCSSQTKSNYTSVPSTKFTLSPGQPISIALARKLQQSEAEHQFYMTPEGQAYLAQQRIMQQQQPIQIAPAVSPFYNNSNYQPLIWSTEPERKQVTTDCRYSHNQMNCTSY